MQRIINYAGSKQNLAKLYPSPQRNTVVEPFAGGAAYSLHYEAPHVILVEKCPYVASIWRYLIHTATIDEIMSLDPTLTSLNDDCKYPLPLQYLIRYWFGRGDAGIPRKKMTPSTVKYLLSARSLKSKWGMHVQQCIANALPLIKNWEIIEGDWSQAPIGDFHYFVDPPYQKRGSKLYSESSNALDFEKLGEWCMARDCATVCEADDADWLPFTVLKSSTNNRRERYDELIYHHDRNSKVSNPFIEQF